MGWLALLLLHAMSMACCSASTHRHSHHFPVAGHHRRGHHYSSAGPRASAAFVSPSSNVVGKANELDHGGLRDIRLLMAGNVDIDTSTQSASASALDNSDDDTMNGDDDEYVDRGLRFSGVGKLYANREAEATTDGVLDRLSSATVAVIGLGGVGSWAAESLCRSGVGNLILVDLDDICISNTNRQLHATSSAVGKMKIDEMKRRLLDINPKCNVTLIHDFVSKDNANDLLQSMLPELTACIDAIDGMYEKTALILACVHHSVPIVTCGGAAGRMDPTQIVVDDLTKVQEDRLLFKCRKLMRQKHGFAKVPMPGKGKQRVRRWKIPAVYSTEVQQKMMASNGDEGGSTSSFRTCDGALGTACFVTGTYGFVAACKVVEMIALDKLIVPKKQGRSE